MADLTVINAEGRPNIMIGGHNLFDGVRAEDFGAAFGRPPIDKPANYGLSLPGVYAVWLLVLLALYPLCRWFAGLKQRHTEWWWSYL